MITVGDDQTLMLRERRFGRPIVFIDRVGSVADADTVTADNRGGARAALSHLAAHGHRMIAFIGDASWIWTASERHLGYLEALIAEGIRLEPVPRRNDLAPGVRDRAGLRLVGKAGVPEADGRAGLGAHSP